MALRMQPTTVAPSLALDTAYKLKVAAQTRLSGVTTDGAECNPVDLGVDPFSRVSYFDFESEGTNLKVVEFVQVADDADDW